MDKDPKKAIRNRSSYREFRELALWLDGEHSKEEVLRRIDCLLNSHNAYGSITKAGYAKESLNLVLEDCELGRLRR